MILALKSLVWLLSTGLAFAGAWWFKFVTDDPDRAHHVKLTPAGRRARYVAVTALALTVILELISWRQAEAKEKRQQDLVDRAEQRADRMEQGITTILRTVNSLQLPEGSAASEAIGRLGSNSIVRDAVSDDPSLAEMLAQTSRFMSGQIVETGLQDAIKAGNVAEVRRLVAGGASLDRQGDLGQTPLHYAAQEGNSEIVNLLLAARSDPNAKTRFGGETALHHAAMRDDVAVANALLASGADPNITNSTGASPLGQAIFFKHAKVVPALLRAGAKVNVEDSYGDTPLKQATFWGDRAVVAQLLAAGADPNYRPRHDGVTAIHRLARIQSCLDDERLAVMDDLVKAGAQCETSDSKGATPLLFAVQFGCESLVSRLLQCGARADAKFPDGKDAATKALELGHPRIAELLKKAAR